MSAPVLAGPSPQSGGPDPFPEWDEVLADIGDRIRAERQALGWSQTKLAQRTGVVLTTIKHLENDGSCLLRTYALACKAMGVDMGHLLSAGWEMPERRLTLSPAQVRVLAVVADGRPLSDAARVLGITREAVSASLSKVYVRLEVSDAPRGQRREMAVRVARQHHLIDAA